MKKIVNLSVLIIALTLTISMGIASLVSSFIMSFGGSNHSILFKIAHASEQIYWEDIPRCCRECWTSDYSISAEDIKDMISEIKEFYK